MSDLNVVAFPSGLTLELFQEADETLTDPEQRQAFGRMCRGHRALMSAQLRAGFLQARYLRESIDEADRLIERLGEQPETEA